MPYYEHNGRRGLYLEIAMSEPLRCEMCGTPVDASDYQDDGYRHTDGRCTEYLKAALSAANNECARLAKGAAMWAANAERFREALDEIAMNAENLVKGGLPHFSRKEFAQTVAFRARHALGAVPSNSTEEKP